MRNYYVPICDKTVEVIPKDNISNNNNNNNKPITLPNAELVNITLY